MDGESATGPTREQVREVIGRSAAWMLAARLDNIQRDDKEFLKLKYLPAWAAYYSILATDDQEAIMQAQRLLAKEQQRLTKAMHRHSKMMLWLSIVMLAMTTGIVVLTILLIV